MRVALFRDSLSVGVEGRQADTLAFPYGTFCKAIGVKLDDADCHWLVMKASRAEAYPSHWGVEVGVRGWPGVLEGVSVGESALLPVTHHAAWPATSSGLCTMGGLGPDCMSSHSLLPPPSSQQVGVWGERGVWGAKGSQNITEQTLVLHWALKTSLLKTAKQWISALSLAEALIFVS